MNGPGFRLLVVFGLILLLTGPPARAVYECGGEEDTCSCGRDNYCLCDGTCGNCVWHAWHMACCEWDRALEWCTDAGTWDEYAPNNGYPTGSDPHAASIFVCNPSTACSQWGHVGWVVTAYPDGSFDSTEQFWGGPCGTHDRHRDPGFATGGFIYNPDHPEEDNAAFVSETIPDGTRFTPGETFTKQWTMRNTGTSTWTRDDEYIWTWDGEERFGAEEQTLLPGGESVAPDSTWDWQVELIAPSVPGTYRGYWRMDNFGVGRFGDRVWVEIVVEEAPDGGTDAGIDASTDAGPDAGTDAGADPDPGDASAGDELDAGNGDEEEEASGCGCAGYGRGTSAGLTPMLVGIWLLWRRRR